MTASPRLTSDPSGTHLLWVTFFLMLLSAVGFSVLGSLKPMKLRAHAIVSTGICTVAAASYYAIASNAGKTAVPVGDGSSFVRRDVFYARYIDWVFTTPLLLLDVLLIAGSPFGTVVWIIFLDVLMIVLGLFGALTVGHLKWGWFGFACAAQALITYGLLVNGVKDVRNRSSALLKHYLGFTLFLAILWIAYPIVWALAEGGNIITEEAESTAYAVLDIIAKVLFGWAIMLGTGPIHKVQLEEESSAGYAVQPLTTPINDIWGAHVSAHGAGDPVGHSREPASTQAGVEDPLLGNDP